MDVTTRLAIERRIVRATAEAILKAGMTISIDNGGDPDEELGPFSTVEEVMANIMQTDEDRFYMRGAGAGRKTRQVLFVYGNDGFDVLADYSVTLEETLKPVFKLAAEEEAKAT